MEETAVLYKHPESQMQHLYFFRNTEQRDVFLKSPELFSSEKLFPPVSEIPVRIEAHNAAQIITKEKNLANYCPVTLSEDYKVVKGYHLYLVFYKGELNNINNLEGKFIFETPIKLTRFLSNPVRYAKVTLPHKMPPINETII